MSLEELKRKRESIGKRESSILANMDMIVQETYRVADVAHNAEQTLNDLDLKFERLTGLNKLDITFLLFATALQCIRQYLLSNKTGRFKKDSDGTKPLKKVVPKDYQSILLGPVPYDAFRKSSSISDINTGISGANHRYTVLGHDPLLGWIFGTLNILTDSVTKNNVLLESYRVIDSKTIDVPVSIVTLAEEGYSYVTQDYKLLIVSVIRQALHLGSDAFTKMGLPIPIINSVSPDLSSKLLKHGIDIYSVSRGATLSMLINSIIAAVHGLFYDEKVYQTRDVYEVKTRKILSYSNFMATTSNVIYVAVSALAGNESAVTKLDLGGMIVTIYRLINDYNFIQRVKEEFVFGGFDNLIKGEEYKFEG